MIKSHFVIIVGLLSTICSDTLCQRIYFRNVINSTNNKYYFFYRHEGADIDSLDQDYQFLESDKNLATLKKELNAYLDQYDVLQAKETLSPEELTRAQQLISKIDHVKKKMRHTDIFGKKIPAQKTTNLNTVFLHRGNEIWLKNRSAWPEPGSKTDSMTSLESTGTTESDEEHDDIGLIRIKWEKTKPELSVNVYIPARNSWKFLATQEIPTPSQELSEQKAEEYFYANPEFDIHIPTPTEIIIKLNEKYSQKIDARLRKFQIKKHLNLKFNESFATAAYAINYVKRAFRSTYDSLPHDAPENTKVEHLLTHLDQLSTAQLDDVTSSMRRITSLEELYERQFESIEEAEKHHAEQKQLKRFAHLKQLYKQQFASIEEAEQYHLEQQKLKRMAHLKKLYERQFVSIEEAEQFHAHQKRIKEFRKLQRRYNHSKEHPNRTPIRPLTPQTSRKSTHIRKRIRRKAVDQRPLRKLDVITEEVHPLTCPTMQEGMLPRL